MSLIMTKGFGVDQVIFGLDELAATLCDPVDITGTLVEDEFDGFMEDIDDVGTIDDDSLEGTVQDDDLEGTLRCVYND